MEQASSNKPEGIPIKALVDGDIISYVNAASAENEDEAWIACSRADHLINSILEDTNSDECELWLSGEGNFRYSIYPEYKANRKDMYRPKWEAEVRQHLLDQWPTYTSTGCEADDMLGVRQCELSAESNRSIICTIDKDLNQIPGSHYSWEIRRDGEVIRETKRYLVTPEEGLRWFYYQLLVGDPTDNIKGCKGIGKKKAEKLLSQGSTEEEWFELTRAAFKNDDEMLMNGQCLWIWRKVDDIWQLPYC